MDPLAIHVLGAPTVARAGTPIDLTAWSAATARNAFLYLLDCQHGASPDALKLAFWPDAAPARARSSLTTTIQRARCAVGRSVIVWRDDRYRVALPPSSTHDLAAFRDLVSSAHAGATLDDKTRHLEAALAFVRGEYLEGLAYDWVVERRWSVEHEITEAMLALADAYSALARWRPAARWYNAAVQRDELREDAHRGLMRAYARQGNRAMAARQFTRLAEILARELGVAPDPRTVALHDVIVSE